MNQLFSDDSTSKSILEVSDSSDSSKYLSTKRQIDRGGSLLLGLMSEIQFRLHTVSLGGCYLKKAAFWRSQMIVV